MKKVIVTNFLFLFFILFSTGLYAQPALNTPADKAAGVSIEPTLSWAPVAEATNYRLQISTDAGFSSITYETLLSACEWTPATAEQRLENNKQYYWHVRANVSPYPYSETRTFYTIAEVKPVLTYPIKNVKLYTKSANFAWYTNPYSSGVKFDLLYSTSAPVDNMLVSPTVVSDLDQAYYTLDPLEGGKTYYWQVRSKSAGGTIISYSAIESFSSPNDPGPIVPTPCWPVGGATVYTSTPDLVWYLGSADPGLQFKVYYSHTSFSNATDPGVKFIDWSTDGYASITEELEPGDWYWRVKSRLASDNTKESSLSAESHFKIYSGLAQTAPVPVPSWPMGNATVYSTSVQFCWYLTTFVPGLSFQIRYKKLSDTEYGTPTDWSTDSYAFIDGLTAGETYLWQVRSSLDGTDGKASGWSSLEAKFKTDGGIVPAAVVPTPLWPVKGTTVYSKTPYFSWYVGGDGTGLQYLVEYADDKDFSVNKVTLDPTTDLFISGSENALLAGKDYYWHVKSSLDGLNWSEPSAAANFKVVADAAVKPLKPIISSPWPGSQITSTSAELQWYLPGSSAGLKYRVEVYYSAFSPDNIFTSIGDLTEMTATVPGLTPGATYVWLVYSYEDGNESNMSEASAVASFMVSPGVSSSIVPLTGSPVKGVNIKTDSPVLSWFVPASSTSLKYELQYSLKKDMSDALSLTGIASNFKALSGLSAGSKYYWRVRSFNAEGKPSEFSSVESFVAASVTGVENKTMIPAKFEVAPNYPNPFNPSTTIKVSLPAAAFLSVKIYNMLGQEVRALISAQTQAGVHSVIWHGEDNSGSILPSGAYIYRVTAGKNITSGKMMFLK